MRKGGGKDKGSVYEREICTKLSLWISGGKDRDLFWRSAMSGGRATVARQKGLTGMARQAGDITATAPEGHTLTDHFYVECKRYAKLDFGAFLTKQKGVLAKFWQDTVEQAVRHGRIPMLIAREDFNEDVVIVPNQALLERGRTGITFNFPADALVARMYFVKGDIYTLEGILAKPFHPPSRWKDDGGVVDGPMLKPGEIARILAGPTPPAKTLEDAKVLEAAHKNLKVPPALVPGGRSKKKVMPRSKHKPKGKVVKKAKARVAKKKGKR